MTKTFLKRLPVMAAILFALSVQPCRAAMSKDAALHFMQGLMLENGGKDAEALEEFKKALQLDKDALYIYRHAAKTALRAGNFEDAAAWADKLAAAEPSKAENWTLVGGINWAGRNIQAARTAYEKALALEPDNADALYQCASMLSTMDPDKSVEYFQRLLKTRPPNAAEVRYRLGLIYYKLGRPNDAIESLKAAVREEPSYMEARYMLAQFYEARGSTESALAAYMEASERDSGNAAVLSHIGGMFLAGGKDAEAQLYFEKARAADKVNHAANYGLAVLAEKRGDFLGVANYLKTSEAYGRDPNMWVRSSYYLTQAGALSEAVDNLRQAHAKWPENPEIAYFYSLGLDDSGKSAQAMEVLAELLKTQPDYRDAKLQYAVLNEKTGKTAEAERLFREILQSRPDDAYVLNYLGYMLTEKNLKLDEARGFISRALELEPQNGAYVDSMGWVEFKLGRGETALSHLRKAAELMNADPSVWEHLGAVFASLGKEQNAWFCYRVSAGLKPSDAVSKKAAALEKKMSSGQLSELYAKYLDARYGGYDSFSALCKITVKAGLREFYLDGLLRYKAGGGVWLDFMGPMLTPVWTLRLLKDGGKQTFEISDPDFMPEPAAELRPFAESVLRLLERYYGGSFSGRTWELSGRKLESGDELAQLSDDQNGLLSISGGKTRLSFTSFARQGVKSVPTALLFQDKVSVRLSVTQWNASFPSKEIAVPR